MAVYNINGIVIASEGDESFLDTAYMKLLKSISQGTVQGACTDGEYIYYCIYNLNELHKYNLLTGVDTTKTYSSGLYNHANDMTYNPNTERIYIATMDATMSLRKVIPSTLEDDGAIILRNSNGTGISVSGIAYDRKANKYIASSGSNYYVYDSSFNYVSSGVYNHGAEWTYQGLECDSDYIFRPLWKTGENVVDILTHNYVHVGRINLPNATEVETLINNWDGNWYINFNTPGEGGGLYYLGLYNKYPYRIIDSLAHDTVVSENE